MDRNKLQSFATIGEIISAIAIVLSLLYAAYEFRHSGTLSKREVETLLYQQMREMNVLIVQTPGLAEHPAGLPVGTSGAEVPGAHRRSLGKNSGSVTLDPTGV